MKALLLDLDGTLADTLPALRQVYASFLADHGIDDPAVGFETMNGRPIREILARLRRDAGLAGDLEGLERDYRARVEAACAHAKAMPGAVSLLARAQAAGLRIAVVTSAPSPVARAWLAREGLADAVDRVIGGEDVDTPKPAPAPYRAALAAVGVEADEAIAVEDAPLGAASACAAGLVTYALCAKGERRQAQWPAASIFIERLDEVSLTP